MFDYSIREATKDDIESVYEIELESFKSPWIIENYINEFNIPLSRVIVAEHGEHVIGYALIWIVADEIHLNKIAVAPGYRRKGVASALIGYITAKYESTKLKVILLEVREKNTGARKFYKKLGFRENGLRKNYYPDDNAVLIEKKLTNEDK